MTKATDVVELIRAPAALTVLGDSLAGRAAAGSVGRLRTLPIMASSVLLYSAGMALNDYSDADLDAVERPDRPIPSGRITRRCALAWAGGLTAAGLGAAAIAGRGHVILALPLAGLIWTYDLVAKPTVWGPVVMAGCRAVDVLMGAGTGVGDRRAAAGAAAIVGAHTLSVTALSRGEVNGTRPAVAAASVVASCLVSAAAVVLGGGDRRARSGAAVAAAAFLATVLPAQTDAVENSQAGPVRDATRAGIAGMVPLQAAIAAARGRTATALGLGALMVAGRVLVSRRRGGDLT